MSVMSVRFKRFLPLITLFFLMGAQAASARDLYLSVNKQSVSLGEAIIFKVHAYNPSPVAYMIDLYIYDSFNFLEQQISVKAGPVFPSNFPVTVSYTPLKTDVYTAKLWMYQPILSRNAYLEDTMVFTVLSSAISAQTATTAYTAQTTVTKTTETIVTITSTTTYTRVDVEITKVTWTNMIVISTVVAAIVVAFVVGNRIAVSRKNPDSE